MNRDFPEDDDGNVLRSLAANGSDLLKEMDVDFMVDVPDRETGEAFAAIIRQRGFNTNVELGAVSGRWTCYCTVRMVASYQAIIDIQKMLGDVGRPYNARPDGWGSFGNADVS